MPLSDHEQRLLEQIEQALYDEDPKFARLYQSTDVRSHYRARVYRSVAGVVLGIGVLLAGAIVPLVPLGVVGFLVMLASGMYLVTSWQRMVGRKATVTTSETSRFRRRRRDGRADSRRPDGERRSLIQRLEERWERRRDEGRF